MKFTGFFDTGFDEGWVREDLRAAMRRYGEYELVATDTPPPLTEERVLAALRRTDVALTGWATPLLPLCLLEDKPRRLKYICHLTGTIREKIPRAYLEAGIVVTNWGNGPMWFLAEANVALMLALLKDVTRIGAHMRHGKEWVYRFPVPTPTLRYKTIGYVGFGAIARIVHTLLHPFECKTILHDPFIQDAPPTARRVALEELFEQADIVTVQCGLHEGSRGLIGKDLLRRLKPHALFVNTARGAIVKERELVEFLRERPDVLAGLDVYEVEPLPKDSPLLDLPNALCYPHSVGEGGEETLKVASAYATRNLLAYFAGQPLEAVITPEKSDRMT